MISVPPEPTNETKPNYRYTPPPKFLKTVQKYSAYGISVFAGLHLTSTVVLPPLSLEASNSAFMFARNLYQSSLGEPIFIYLMFGAHVFSGIALRLFRMYHNFQDFGKLKFPKITFTQFTGLFLTVLVAGHFGALRYAPIKALGDSSLMSLDFIGYNLQHEKLKTSFILSILTLVFTVHGVMGARMYSKFFRSLWRFWWALLPITLGYTLWGLSKLSKVEVSGWLGEQFELVHAAFP